MFITINDVISFSALYKSAIKCKKGVMWKNSAQDFALNMLTECAKLRRDLLKDEYVSRGFIEFKINERGKERDIKSVHITERVVQKSLSQNALKPIMEPLLIENNAASRKGRGTEFAIEHLKKHLTEHYEKYGTQGGILIMDLHNYFGSIDHEILLEKLREIIQDDRIYELTKYFIECFDEGLGLGSEISQDCAIFYPNNIDHYIVDELKLPYGRYMDDSYIICNDIERLKEIRDEICQMYKDLHIEMNLKKTQIIRFEKGDFTYLKKRWHLNPDGTIDIRLQNKVYSRVRRKLKKLKQKLDDGIVDMEKVRITYNSWRSSIDGKYNTEHHLYDLDRYYFQLFNEKYTGETIEDIKIRKILESNLPFEDIKKQYKQWHDEATWYKSKKKIVKMYDKIYKEDENGRRNIKDVQGNAKAAK